MKNKIIILICILVSNLTLAQNFDINILKQLNGKRNTSLDNFFVNTSNAVPVATTILPVGMLVTGLIKKDKKLIHNGLGVALTYGINTVATFGLKYAVARPRPAVTYPGVLDPLDDLTKNSFPSGHTSNAFSTATIISIQYPKWYVVVPSYTVASLTAYSRMHMGVHYPSDVITGAAVGVLSAFVSNKLNNRFHRYDGK